jgi:hypothetical protein
MASHAPVHDTVTAYAMVPSWMLTAVSDVTLAATAAFLLFVVQYTLTSPWWKDRVGTTIVLKDIVLLCILVPGSLLVFFPHLITPVTSAWIDIFVLGGAAAVMCWRCVVWWLEKKPAFVQRWLDRRSAD